MVVKLMNSAFMPEEGVYTLKRITPEEARKLLNKATKIESYVGYSDTANYMSRVLGIEVPVNRGETTLEDGDIMLICRLSYRVQNPQDKGRFTPSEKDFEWFVCEFKK